MLDFNRVSMHYPYPRGLWQLLRHPRTRQYNHSLRDVSFTIKLGERVALLGSNGAGKTTLLKLAGGLLYPAQGKIAIGGFDSVGENDRCRAAAGYVLNEERSFYWRLTGRDNLRFFAALDNVYGEEFQKRAEVLFASLGLSEAADSRVSGYSSGMRQRLSIARGLFSRPDLLLLDEPTKSLDPEGTQEIRQLITRETPGRTLLIATHSFNEARELCDRVLILAHGKLIADEPLMGAQGKAGTLEDFYFETCGIRTPVGESE